MPVDRETVNRFNLAIKAAEHTGRPLVEVLDQLGLLTTPARTHRTTVAAIELVCRLFDEQDASKLMRFFHGSESGTPADMFRAVDSWLEVLLRHVADQIVKP